MNKDLIMHELFNIFRNISLCAYMLGIVMTWICDREKTREFSKKHRILSGIFMVLCVSGAILFITAIPRVLR